MKELWLLNEAIIRKYKR